MAGFNARLDERLQESDSRVCVGLDPQPELLPAGTTHEIPSLVHFLRAVVDSTAPYVAAYKPNIAFYEALGTPALDALVQLIEHIHDTTDALVILDAKRGDVGHTASAYARAAYDLYRADAVTVSPYLGRDSVSPFAEAAAKGVFVLARTSNPSAPDVQDLRVERRDGGGTSALHLAVARAILDWNTNDNLGLVAGATWPGELRKLREAVGDELPFLVPGVGAQGGDARTAAQAAADSNGRGFLINSGRAVLHAGNDDRFADAAASAAKRLRDQIQTALATAKP